MGLADSPLQGRVLFVEGAPRSGTTWITALLATHPSIAGTGSESHLFDVGVGSLFDNHESPTWGTHLSAYVSADELTNLVRDLCDGVLLRIRERAKPDAEFVVEKTPVFTTTARTTLERKLRCYPDAWYLHILRDEEATARSLMRAPISPVSSDAAARRGVREAADAIREVLGASPRYLEVRHEELQADQVAGVTRILHWLGLEAGEEAMERVRALAGEHFSRFPDPAGDRPRGAGGALRRLAAEGRRAARRLWVGTTQAASGPGELPGPAIANRLIATGRSGDLEAVREATTDDFSIEIRTGHGDLTARGDDARRAWLDFGGRVLDAFFVTVEWVPASGDPYDTFLFHGITADAARVDVSLHAFPKGDRIGRLTVISAGALDGRPLQTWSGEGEQAPAPEAS